MQASWLGKVSHDKRRQAITPSPLIVASAINVVLNERCQSLARRTPRRQRGKPWQHSALMPQGGLADERDKSVMRALWVSRQNSSRDGDYCCSGVIAATHMCRNKQEALPWQEVSSRLGKYMPHDLLRRNRQDQRKQKQAAKTSTAAWHVERSSRAQHSQHKQRKWVDRQHQGHDPQTTRRAQATTTTATPYYFGGIPKIKDDACCSFSGSGRNKRSRVFF